MPEMQVAISDISGHQLAIQSTGVITVSQTPENAMVYTTLVEDVPSVNTANTYLSIFNPVGSGKVLIFGQAVFFPYASGAQATTINMDVQRISAASGGTLLAAANVVKFDSTDPNSVAEVRTGNPTVTLVGTVPFLAVPPAIATASSGVNSTIGIIPPSGSQFVCRPGEGVAAKQSAGAGTTQRWSFGFTWLEM